MRELKFRAWDNYNKKMIIEPFKITSFLNGVAELHTTNYLKQWDALMQFTGLHDKNGVEIYGGDRVRWHTWDGYEGDSVVEFNSGRFYPVADGCLEYNRFDERQGLEVIGNIYESKELLT